MHYNRSKRHPDNNDVSMETMNYVSSPTKNWSSATSIITSKQPIYLDWWNGRNLSELPFTREGLSKIHHRESEFESWLILAIESLPADEATLSPEKVRILLPLMCTYSMRILNSSDNIAQYPLLGESCESTLKYTRGFLKLVTTTNGAEGVSDAAFPSNFLHWGELLYSQALRKKVPGLIQPGITG